ncbi:MAG TPA: hypothetical protein VL172_20715, partial [Kofleriaceae bacterium]|nr:hypothetical protein [Kofleriaceae bacterium]
LAAGGRLDGLADDIGERVRPLVAHGAAIGIQAIYDLGQFEVPRDALAPAQRQIGIGVAQSASDPAGRIGVVVVVAR